MASNNDQFTLGQIVYFRRIVSGFHFGEVVGIYSDSERVMLEIRTGERYYINSKEYKDMMRKLDSELVFKSVEECIMSFNDVN